MILASMVYYRKGPNQLCQALISKVVDRLEEVLYGQLCQALVSSTKKASDWIMQSSRQHRSRTIKLDKEETDCRVESVRHPLEAKEAGKNLKVQNHFSVR